MKLAGAILAAAVIFLASVVVAGWDGSGSPPGPIAIRTEPPPIAPAEPNPPGPPNVGPGVQGVLIVAQPVPPTVVPVVRQPLHPEPRDTTGGPKPKPKPGPRTNPSPRVEPSHDVPGTGHALGHSHAKGVKEHGDHEKHEGHGKHDRCDKHEGKHEGRKLPPGLAKHGCS